MEIDEQLKPNQDNVVQEQVVHERQKAAMIFPKLGQKVWRVDKVTNEVTEVVAQVSAVQTIGMPGNFAYQMVHHKHDGDPIRYFYTAALNKKNALRHYDKWLNLNPMPMDR